MKCKSWRRLSFLLLFLSAIPLCGLSPQKTQGIEVRNNVYVVSGNVNLRGKTLTMPPNIELRFDNGEIANGTIIFNNTKISGNAKIKTEVKGSISNETIDVSWFDIKDNNRNTQTNRLQQVINLFANNVPRNSWDINLQQPEPQILFPKGRFNLGEIHLRSYVTIKGQGRGSTELRGVSFIAENQYNINIEDVSLFGRESAPVTNMIIGEEKSAFVFKNCGRLLFKNVVVRNYDKAFDFYNTVLSDFYSCYVSYCLTGFCNDGSGAGFGGHAIRWFGGEICNCDVGFSQRMGNSVDIIGSTIENCSKAIDLEYPVSFNISSCYFEANIFDIYGNIIHTNIENNFFSDAHKTAEGTYIYANSIGLTTIRGNKFNKQIGSRPYIEVQQGAAYYHNLSITQNDMVGGGRIVVSRQIEDAIEERGRLNYQQYLPDGEQMFMGQLIMYKDPKTSKYYIITRNEEGKLLYIQADYLK